MGGIADRYAAALYDMASEAKVIDAVADDLRGLDKLLNESKDLRRLVQSTLIDRLDQTKAMLAVLDQAGVNELTRRFVGVVGQHRRLSGLTEIIAGFLAILARRRGEETAHVTSAVPLSGEQQDALNTSLRDAVGSKVVVETEVDPDLIGGLIIRVGSRMIDSSIRTKLQKMRLVMKGVG
jgi:F-type H+-transporting ATPase subunit delta